MSTGTIDQSTSLAAPTAAHAFVWRTIRGVPVPQGGLTPAQAVVVARWVRWGQYAAVALAVAYAVAALLI